MSIMSLNYSYCHGSVNAQAVEKLFLSVQEKVALCQSMHKIPELKQIWNNITQNTNAVSASCSVEAIVKLVEGGHLNIDDAFETITTSSASAKNTRWLVHLAFKLLKVQYFSTSKECEHCKRLYNKSPYQLRSHTHPLIYILNSSSHSWISILSEVQVLFFDSMACMVKNKESKIWNASSIIEMLQPFLVYVFLNPSIEESLLHFQTSLFFAFANNMFYKTSDSIENSDCDKHPSVIQFALEILCSVKVMEIHLQLYNHLFAIINASSNLMDNTKFISKFAFLILSSCYSQNQSPISVGLTCLLSQLLNLIPCINKAGVFSICLANLICCAPPEVLPYLLECIVGITKPSNWLKYGKIIKCSCVLSIKAAILQLLSSKHMLGFNKHSPIFYKALDHIENIVLKWLKEDKFLTTKDIETEIPFNGSWFSDAHIVLQGLIFYETMLNVSGFQCLLQTKISENVALNMALAICGICLGDLLLPSLFNDDYKQFLGILTQIVFFRPQLSLHILPTILYAVRTELNSSKQRTLLLQLPEFAVDQNSMPLILGAIQALGQVERLFSLAIRLMVQLWKKQDRCFPYLQKMLSYPQHQLTNISIKREIDTATAIAIKELCESKLCRQNSEVAAHISNLLKKRLHPGQVTLLLEGLYFLLDSKVLNIKSTWYELLKDISPSYSCVNVTKAIFKILSLVPKHEVENSSFVHFKTDILSWIWHHSESTDKEIKGSMLLCLAHFKRDDLIVKYLPTSMQPIRPETVPSDDFLEQKISGECLVKVWNIAPLSFEAQFFSTQLLTQEIQTMPRDIKDRAYRIEKQNFHGGVFDGFSKFLLKMYEKNKQPNLKSPFASCVLMCYNPSLEDSPNNLVTLSRNALQLVQSLIGEVNVDGKNWKSLLWIVHAWKQFMKICFQIMVKGRNAELNLQLQQKDCDQEDIQHKKKTIDFWCRDKITDLLKNSSKGTPTMQGNSILALGALYCALQSNRKSSSSPNDVDNPSNLESSGYLSNDHWLDMVADTLISIADSQYSASGRIFSWCQYKAVSNTGRLTTSKFGEVCALQALRMMLPMMVPYDIKRVKKFLPILVGRISNQSKENSRDQSHSPLVTLHINFVVGSITGYLYRKKLHESTDDAFCETIALSTSCLLENVAKTLGANLTQSDEDNNDEEDEEDGDEDNAEDEDDDEDDDEDNSSSDDDSEETTVSLLGIAELLPALFSLGNAKLKRNAYKVFNSMVKHIQSLEEMPGVYLEAFYFPFVSACVSAKDVKFINFDSLNVILGKIKKIFLNNKNIPTAIALSHLCFILNASGEKKANILYKELYSHFLKQSSNTSLPTRHKLASVNGLVAIVGSEIIFSGQHAEFNNESESNLKQAVNLLKEYVQQGKEPTMISNCVVLLGHLYMSFQSSTLFRSSPIPKSYSYLPESSILKPMFDILLSIENRDDFECNDNAKLVLKSLSEVAYDSMKHFPPVNWFVPLAKIIKYELNEDEQLSCIQIGLSQSVSNTTAATFVSNCIVPSKFESLHVSSQSILLQNLHVMLQSLPNNNVLSFITYAQSLFINNTKPPLMQAILCGFLLLLQSSTLPPDVTNISFTFFQQLVKKHHFSLSDDQYLNQWKTIASCIGHFPNLTYLDEFKEESNLHIKIIFIKCHLLSEGHASLQWLDKHLHVCCQSKNKELQSNCLWIIFNCLKNVLIVPSMKGAVKEWLPELLVNVVKYSGNQSSEIFMLKILSICIITLTILSDKPFNTNISKPTKNEQMFLWDQCLLMLPNAVKKFLLQKSTTDAVAQQLISLFLHLHQTTFNSNPIIENCLFLIFKELAHVKSFQKSSFWANIACILMLR